MVQRRRGAGQARTWDMSHGLEHFRIDQDARYVGEMRGKSGCVVIRYVILRSGEIGYKRVLKDFVRDPACTNGFRRSNVFVKRCLFRRVMRGRGEAVRPIPT